MNKSEFVILKNVSQGLRNKDSSFMYILGYSGKYLGGKIHRISKFQWNLNKSKRLNIFFHTFLSCSANYICLIIILKLEKR